MKIKIKPVKCGDCSILYGEKQGLLIDCGSDNAHNDLSGSKFSFSTIAQEIEKNEITDIMISHFHKDHFNGILEIPEKYSFNRTYLPYSVIDGKVIYIRSIARLLAIAPTRSWGFKLSKNILDLFRKLNIISEEICFVKKGDIIPFAKNEIRVLWPEIEETGYRYGDIPFMYNHKPFKSTNTVSLGISNETQQKFPYTLGGIEEIIEQRFTEIIINEHQEFFYAVEEFSDLFEEYILTLHILHNNNNENRENVFDSINRALSNLNEQRKIFFERSDEAKLKSIKKFSHMQYHYLITCMNAISIVCDCENQFLFLGDVPVNIISYIRLSMNDEYKFIKIQHHGTKKYFTSNMPIGNCNLISNGGFERRRVCADFINYNQIVCTNAHDDAERFCDYCAETGRCSDVCIKVKDDYVIDIECLKKC